MDRTYKIIITKKLIYSQILILHYWNVHVVINYYIHNKTNFESFMKKLISEFESKQLLNLTVGAAEQTNNSCGQSSQRGNKQCRGQISWSRTFPLGYVQARIRAKLDYTWTWIQNNTWNPQPRYPWCWPIHSLHFRNKFSLNKSFLCI